MRGGQEPARHRALPEPDGVNNDEEDLGGPSLYVAPTGAIYALLPPQANQREQARGRGAAGATGRDLDLTRDDLDALPSTLLASYLQRQQQQQELQQQRQQQLLLQALTGGQQRLPVEDVLPRPQLDEALLQATLLQALQQQQQQQQQQQHHALLHQPLLHPGSGNLGAAMASDFAPRGTSSRRMESNTNDSQSDSQSPPPSGRDRGSQLGAASAQLSAKEKNRQAQRRFRERQKDLIASLKHRVDSLQARLAENDKEIVTLREENAMLRGRLEGKASNMLPAEALQSLLQMSGAGLLADMAANAASGAALAARADMLGVGGGGGGAGGNGAGGSGLRRARSGDMS